MNLQAFRPLATVVWLLLTAAATACAPATTVAPPAPTPTPSAEGTATLAATGANRTSLPPTATAASIATASTLPAATATSAQAPATPAPAATARSNTLEFNFDKDAVGGVPAGATVFNGTWAVRAEPGAPSAPNALCQTGTATFPALALTAQKFADVAVSVRFKPISGRTDQAAGIIFRIQDKDNYDIVRANALEANVNIYKYVNGQRIDIKDGSGNVASGQWQELRIEAVGNCIRGFFEGQQVVETTDDTYKTGAVGLWTKADSTTCFDNVQISVR